MNALESDRGDTTEHRSTPDGSMPPSWPQQHAWSGPDPRSATKPGSTPAAARPVGADAAQYAKAKTLSTVALVLGIVGMLVNPLGGVSIAALVCGILAKSQIDDLRRRGAAAPSDGSAIAGIVLGGLGLASTAFFKAGLF